MNKYEHSKIYKIVNDVDDMVYVGSTYQKLERRWVFHMYDYKRHPEYNLYKKMHEIGIEHFKIILISIYPCETKEQLFQREREEFDKYGKDKLVFGKHVRISPKFGKMSFLGSYEGLQKGT